MNLRTTLLTLCLLGFGLSYPLKAAAEPALFSQQVSQPESSEDRQLLPWQSFPSTSGNYIIDLPGTPLEQTSTSPLLERELRWQMASVTLPAVDESDLFEYYLVAYADIPRSLRYDFSQKELLDAAATRVVSDIQDEQLSATLTVEEVAFQGLPSRLMTAEGLGQFLVATLSITGDRLYLVLAIDDDQANFEHFYNSFSVVP
jgi:hypothetical protein